MSDSTSRPPASPRTRLNAAAVALAAAGIVGAGVVPLLAPADETASESRPYPAAVGASVGAAVGGALGYGMGAGVAGAIIGLCHADDSYCAPGPSGKVPERPTQQPGLNPGDHSDPGAEHREKHPSGPGINDLDAHGVDEQHAELEP